MHTELVCNYDYTLPTELIAQSPLAERSASRLLTVDCQQGWMDGYFRDVLSLIRPEDLLVLNNTRVMPARLFGHKSSGGRFEMLVERLLDSRQALVHLRVSKKPIVGSILHLEGGAEVRYLGREGALFRVEWLGDEPILDCMQRIGHLPLPPYIERADDVNDVERYQTVFAQSLGAVAAPTAGLHFDTELLAQLRQKGVRIETLTLHVGAGTFQPVKATYLHEHQMHSEYVQVSQALVDAVEETKARGGRVVAVGTTVVRALETAATSGELMAFEGETNIFITPGYVFRVIDALITNFHLPQSTLLMLVSAFAGFHRVRAAYAHAIAQKYRFFSYGDAMMLSRCTEDISL